MLYYTAQLLDEVGLFYVCVCQLLLLALRNTTFFPQQHHQQNRLSHATVLRDTFRFSILIRNCRIQRVFLLLIQESTVHRTTVLYNNWFIVANACSRKQIFIILNNFYDFRLCKNNIPYIFSSKHIFINHNLRSKYLHRRPVGAETKSRQTYRPTFVHLTHWYQILEKNELVYMARRASEEYTSRQTWWL